MKVLLVDDNPVTLDALAECLRKAGHLIETAANAPAARTALTLVKPQVIVTDWVMPAGGGHRLVQDLMHDAELAHVPIVLLSALPAGGLEAIQASYPHLTVLQKPVELSQLLEVLEGLADH